MKVKGLRWWIIALIVVITIINYLDRNTLSIMWQSIVADLGLIDPALEGEAYSKASKDMYSYIYMFFMVAYGISQMVSGKLYDRFGVRRGIVGSVIVWAIADGMTAFARGLGSLCSFRALLGLGEAGPWPGAVKSNAEWFPQKERAFAQGLFNSGASIGAILSPIIIAALFVWLGWKLTFVFIAGLGLLWIIPWLIVNKKGPKEHPWITDEEKKYILDGQPEVKTSNEKGLSWGQLLRNKKSYAVILGRFFLDPVWWMFVAWLPIYLLDVYQFDVKSIGMTAWVPYVGAMVGSLAGGWYSGWMLRRGKSVGFARKSAVVIGALIMFPSLVATAYATDVYTAIGLMTLILGGFQFAMGNIQTLPSDLFAGKTVGSLAGLGGAAATLGTIVSMIFIPSLTAGGNWLPFFILGAALVPLCLICVFFFGGRIEHQKTNA